MTDLPENHDSTPDPAPGPDRPRNLRQRRYGAMAAGAESADEPQQSRRGPKLSPREKGILIEYVARLEDAAPVLEALYHDHPDFPQIGESLVRHYRDRLRAGMIEQAKAAYERALQTGIANQAKRIAAADQRHRILTQRFLQSARILVADDGQPLPADEQPKLRLDIARELLAIERQVAEELGAVRPPTASPLTSRGVPSGAPQTARQQTVELLAAIQAKRAEAAAAMAAAAETKKKESA